MAKRTAKSTAKHSKNKTAKKKKKPAVRKVTAIPAGYPTVMPYIVCRGAAKAIEFYKRALGARAKAVMAAPDGSIMHAEILIEGSVVMLGDEMPAMGATSPETIGGTASGIFIYTTNVDKAYARAIAAGAKAEMPPADMFWGDRYCKFIDPFGHRWSVATHIEDVAPKEMARRSDAFLKQQAAGGQQPV
jgi:PhnB protein